MNDKTDELQRGFSTEKTLSTLSPGVLSHFVSGDTPTLYAGSRPNSSSNIDERPLQSNPSGTGGLGGNTGFTFFGMPIPPLNFNNIWSQTKGTGKRLKDSRRNSLPKKMSTIEQDGFTPMLPGTGGFRPMMTTPDHPYFGEEAEDEEDVEHTYENKNMSTRIKEIGGLPRYQFSSTTTESPFHYDRFPTSDVSYSKFVNITTRDSLYESATINSIIRSTAKPNPPINNQQQSAIGISQSDDTIHQLSESSHKSTTGKIMSFNTYSFCKLIANLRSFKF